MIVLPTALGRMAMRLPTVLFRATLWPVGSLLVCANCRHPRTSSSSCRGLPVCPVSVSVLVSVPFFFLLRVSVLFSKIGGGGNLTLQEHTCEKTATNARKTAMDEMNLMKWKLKLRFL